MKISFFRSGFAFRQNLLPLALGIIWLVLLAALLFIGINYGVDTNVCWFRHLFKLNCPTCGTSRIMLSIMHLNFLQAFLINPLVFFFLILFTLYLILRIFFRLDFRLLMTKKESLIFWLTLALIFCLNWAYVILTLK